MNPLFKTDPPPNFALLQKELGVEWKDIAIVYGDTIYSPKPVEDDILAHEMVHVRQQTAMGAEAWWKRYLEDPGFRLDQELEAYHAQYQFWKDHIKNREMLSRVLARMAHDLCSMYRLKLTPDVARSMIRAG